MAEKWLHGRNYLMKRHGVGPNDIDCVPDVCDVVHYVDNVSSLGRANWVSRLRTDV